MRILVLHGDDEAKSRQRFLEEKQLATGDSVSLDGRSLTEEDLVQALSSPSLFGNERTVFIENFFSKTPKSLQSTLISLAEQDGYKLVLWESKKIHARTLKKLPDAEIKEFKVPTIIFKYLDALKPGNTKKSLDLFNKLSEQQDEFYIVSMLIWHLRHLILVRDPKHDDHYNISGWRKKKLIKQSKAFELSRLVRLYRQLEKIDYDQKSGGLVSGKDAVITFTLAISQ